MSISGTMVNPSGEWGMHHHTDILPFLVISKLINTYMFLLRAGLKNKHLKGKYVSFGCLAAGKAVQRVKHSEVVARSMLKAVVGPAASQSQAGDVGIE